MSDEIGGTKKSSNSKVYAVAKGRNTGIFFTWKKAEPLVKGLFSAKFKSFPTLQEAEEFMAQHQASIAASTSANNPNPLDPSTLVAFCDGSAFENGSLVCKAAYACVFPHNEEWNVSGKLGGPKSTNNRAEYLAALEAIKRANIEDPEVKKPLYIYSDSMILIRSMTEWLPVWQKNNWQKVDGTPVKNIDLLERLIHAKATRQIIWTHVKAHTKKKDWKSKWNAKADQLARQTAIKQ